MIIQIVYYLNHNNDLTIYPIINNRIALKIFQNNNYTERVYSFTLSKGKYIIIYGGDLSASKETFISFSIDTTDAYHNNRGKYISSTFGSISNYKTCSLQSFIVENITEEKHIIFIAHYLN